VHTTVSGLTWETQQAVEKLDAGPHTLAHGERTGAFGAGESDGSAHAGMPSCVALGANCPKAVLGQVEPEVPQAVAASADVSARAIARCRFGRRPIRRRPVYHQASRMESAQATLPDRGVEIALHAGYAVPQGHIDSTFALSDFVSSWLRLGVDAGYRFGRRWYAGGAFVWGPSANADADYECKAPGVSCSRHEWQLLAQARCFPWPDEFVGPWVGLGFGWDVATLTIDGPGGSGSGTYSGPIFLDAQLGADVRRRAFAVGPFVGVSLGKFVRRSLDPTPMGFSSSWKTAELHEWLTIGVRGSYGPF
jgi:hypothetical protein